MIAINTDKPMSIGDAADASNTTVKMLRYWEEKATSAQSAFTPGHVVTDFTTLQICRK